MGGRMKKDDNSNIDHGDDISFEVNGLKNYYNEIDKISCLSAEEERELLIKIKQGDQEARQKFIEANLRLVRYAVSSISYSHINLDDLIQEGNIALMHAVDNYDLEKGVRFSSYAVKCIKLFVKKKSFNYNRVFQKSDYATGIIFKFSKCVDKLAKELSHIPSKYEIAETLDISVEEVEKIIMLQQAPISLNGFIPDEDDEIEKMIADPNIDVENEVLLKLYNEDIKNVLNSCLTNQEKKVIYYLVGLDGNSPKSQVEISKILNLTRARINQLAISGLKKLSAVQRENIEEEKVASRKIDIKTKKMLNKVKGMMKMGDYNELKAATIEIRQNEEFDSISSMELIVLLLNSGLIGNKCYAPIEIANILGSDYYSVGSYINGILEKYQLDSEFEKIFKKK